VIAILLATLALVLASGTLEAAVRATFSVGDSRLRTLREEGFEGAEPLDDLRSSEEPIQSRLTLLAMLLRLSALGLLVLLLPPMNPLLLLLALLGGVVVVLVLGVVVPRSIAARQPIRVALGSAPFLGTLDRWVRPVLSPLLSLEAMVAGSAERDVFDHDARDLVEMSELGQREGIVDRDEHLLVQRAFRLDELSAFDVMTPRVDVFAWQEDTQLDEIVRELSSVPYSRVPIYAESIDDVTGILYVREAYESFVAGMGDQPISHVSRDPFFVPGSLPLTQLLRDFQARRIHMGIVADEYGGTDGIVTLEDVLEELVGEIVDETDVEDEPLQRLGRGELVADGGVDLREINYALNVSLPQLEHRSLNGYLLEELGHVPAEGDTMVRNGVQFEVVEATETQVVRARLKRLAEPEQSEMRDAG